MNYFIFPDIDTTIYQATGSSNTGLDEILEVTKTMSTAGSNVKVSRDLIKFDITDISGSIVDGTITNPKFYLNMYDANSQNLTTSQELYAYPISSSWVEGEGTYSDSPITTEGASWKYKNGESDGTLWAEVSSSGGAGISGSLYEASMSLGHETKDIRMNVTDIVNKWLGTPSGKIPNEGFMVKRKGHVGNLASSSAEGSTTRYGNLSFFSSDTHTKYPPTLETVWNDSKWNTGSLSPITGSDFEDMVMYMKGLRPEYKEKSKAKFRVVGRERFPTKTYSTTPANLNVKYLPSGSSFYSIKDAETDDVIVPYGWLSTREILFDRI